MTVQLELLAPNKATAIPLRQALELVASQWTRRLGYPIRVAQSEWGGYRLEKTR